MQYVFEFLNKMFRTVTSKPIPMKPNSYMNKIKNIQAEMLKNTEPDKISVQDPKEMTVKTQVSRVSPESSKQESVPSEKRLQKIDVIPSEKTYKEDEINTDIPVKKQKTDEGNKPDIDEKALERRIADIIEAKVTKFFDAKKEVKEDKPKPVPSPPEEPVPSKNEVEKATYTELKKIFDEKLSSIDDIVNYVRNQKNQPIANYPVAQPKVTEHHVEESAPNSNKSQNKTETVSVDLENSPGDDTKLLGKKTKRSFYQITDSKWKDIRKEFPELKEADKSLVYSDGTDNFIELKGKKVPLNYKAILKFTHDRKAENPPATPEPPKETVQSTHEPELVRHAIVTVKEPVKPPEKPVGEPGKPVQPPRTTAPLTKKIPREYLEDIPLKKK